MKSNSSAPTSSRLYVLVESCIWSLWALSRNSANFSMLPFKPSAVLKTPAPSSIVDCNSLRITDTFSLCFRSVRNRFLICVSSILENVERSLSLPSVSKMYLAAALPALAPKTKHSVRELDPSRFAPFIVTQAFSPAEYKPFNGVCPSLSV